MLLQENDVRIVTENNYFKIFQKSHRVTKSPGLSPSYLQSILENNQLDIRSSLRVGGFRDSRLERTQLFRDVRDVAKYQDVETIKMFQG